MADTVNYQNVVNLPVLEEATENTHVIVEDNGEFKRMSGDNLGGGGVKTAIIRDSNYLNTIAGLQTAEAEAEEVTYECVNMTFEEAYQTMAMGEPLMVLMQVASNGATCVYGESTFVGTAVGVPCIALMTMSDSVLELFWTADGVTTSFPGGK